MIKTNIRVINEDKLINNKAIQIKIRLTS